MAKILLPNDHVLDDGRFLQLVLRRDEDGILEDSFSFDVDRALNILMSDQGLAAALLSQTRPGHTVYWAGERSDAVSQGRTFGVRVLTRRTGTEVLGDNRFGAFLSRVREAFVKRLEEEPLQEQPVRPGQVITDFTRRGAFRSDIEERELSGERFIHVDHYVPARFRHDAMRDGTTGHASRVPGGEGAVWQRFECPFGVAYPATVLVESEAEASLLYEKALRGEVDWTALLRSLRDRDLLGKNINDKRLAAMAQEYKAQFEWMREQISTDRSLRDLPIVAPGLLCRDSSMGRSTFDAVYAPSPAHVLARYINNPLLLYSRADYSVLSSLELKERNESEQIALSSDKVESIDLVVLGSDTIGGREPGRKATSKMVRAEVKDSEGRRIITTRKQWELPLKPQPEAEKDYEAFSARMDSILSQIPKGVKVRMVTGSVSMLSGGLGVGTPRLLERYVKEKGGVVLNWNYYKGSAQKGPKSGDDDSLQVILMENFADVLPVLAGSAQGVSFLRDEANEDSRVSFGADSGLRPGGALCFSVSEDSNFSVLLSEASLFVSGGLPLIHVQENRSVEEQREALASGAVLSRSSLSGEIRERGVLFEGEQRDRWDVGECNMLSFIDSETGFAVPLVSNLYPVPVVVAGQPLRSAFGAYLALASVASGDSSRKTLAGIAAAEGSVSELVRIAGTLPLDDQTQENCLRRAVRLFAAANEPFYRTLMDIDDRPVVMPVSVEDRSGLFIDVDGAGLNRFGMVLTDERARMAELVRARRAAEQEERRRSVEEASRRQKIAVSARADGQLVREGLPSSLAEAGDAVWFIGTNSPDQLVLPADAHSFEMWDDLGGEDPLQREKARRDWVDDGDGGRIPNEFVFLFPSDLAAVTGRRRPNSMPDSRDLTGVTRVDPATGQEFACAFGVPVRMNNRGNEFNNDDGLPCSYRLDNDASNYAQSLVLADSLARSTAFRHGMTLCLPGRLRVDGSPYYTLGQVFMESIYDRKEKRWVDNPHASALNEALTGRYIKLLESGRIYPLNCIPLPVGSYREEDYAPDELSGQRHVSAEGRFLSDLMLSLRIANSMALALGVPLRFPLDKEGRIDLGPGVPESLRALAQHKIESFIGVVKQENLSSVAPFSLRRISAAEVSKVRSGMTKSGQDVYLRPNDLVEAFGRYEFGYILSGQTAPLHEMHFRMDDGTVVSIVDSRLTRGRSREEINEYLRYEKNDERRFIIRSTDPEKIPEFISIVKASIRMAKSVRAETRLVSEQEIKAGAVEGLRDEPLGGFVKLLSSNDDEFADDEHTIGRERTVFNGTNRFDGFDVSDVYWGKEDARDGFKGYAQTRLVYPDGTKSAWTTVSDLDLAKDIVMCLVNRKYASDDYQVPSALALEMFIKGASLCNGEHTDAILAHGLDLSTGLAPDSKVVVLNPTSKDIGEVSPVDRIDKAPDNVKDVVVEGTKSRPGIVWSVSQGGYAQRTRENANADGVDFTLDFAVDFDTTGERCTARAAGDSLIAVTLPVRKGGGLDFSANAVKGCVDQVCDSLPDEFLSGESVGLNIAGNGIFTLAPRGIDQAQCDRFVTRVLEGLQRRGLRVSLVRTGGQTGIDEAGAVAAHCLGVPVEVHAPKGWVYRGADGRDVSGEESFCRRFDLKDYEQLSGGPSAKASQGASPKL